MERHQTTRRFDLKALVTYSYLHKEQRVIETDESFNMCPEPTTVDYILGNCDHEGNFYLDEGDYGYMFGQGKVLSARMVDPANGETRDIPYNQFAGDGKNKTWIETSTLVPAEEIKTLEPVRS